jgi:hypothetical protein
MSPTFIATSPSTQDIYNEILVYIIPVVNSPAAKSTGQGMKELASNIDIFGRERRSAERTSVAWRSLGIVTWYLVYQ